MKKTLTVVVCIILGVAISIPLYSFGARVRWERLDYFPFSVDKLLALKPFGKEIWVETPENEMYKITYPCLNGQTCWETSDTIPSLSSGEYLDEEIHEYINYNFSDGKCETFYDVDFKPLPGTIKTCVTSVALAESFYVVSVVLTNENELWIWNKPWVSPYTLMGNIITALCLGASIGLFVGFLLVMRNVK